jgi:hypothetical protein
MPPAFNLSQDQTLQFDLDFLLLGIEVNFIAEFHFIFLRAFKVMRPELCVTTVFWHSPSNAHAYRLLIFKEHRCWSFDFQHRRLAVSEDRDSGMFFRNLSRTRLLFFSEFASGLSFLTCLTSEERSL